MPLNLRCLICNGAPDYIERLDSTLVEYWCTAGHRSTRHFKVNREAWDQPKRTRNPEEDGSQATQE